MNVSSKFKGAKKLVLNKDLDVVPEQAPLIILNKNKLSTWLQMVITPSTPDTFSG